jgi:hypothetical protein
VFTSASLLKITEVAEMFGATFSRVKLNYDKKGLGDFFTNSSGHPDWVSLSDTIPHCEQTNVRCATAFITFVSSLFNAFCEANKTD